MKKRLIALLLASTMVVSLAACGQDDNQGSTPSGSGEDVQQSQASTPESTPESTPDSTPVEIGRAHV